LIQPSCRRSAMGLRSERVRVPDRRRLSFTELRISPQAHTPSMTCADEREQPGRGARSSVGLFARADGPRRATRRPPPPRRFGRSTRYASGGRRVALGHGDGDAGAQFRTAHAAARDLARAAACEKRLWFLLADDIRNGCLCLTGWRRGVNDIGPAGCGGPFTSGPVGMVVGHEPACVSDRSCGPPG